MRKIGLILFFMGLLWGGIQLWVKPYTGYMDADYYYTVARNLFSGRGFQDYLLWNFLADPVQLPVPAATYWMPAASVIAYLGMLVSGQDTLIAARIPFIVLFAFAASLTGCVSWSIFRSKLYALVSGSLVLLSGFYLKFVTAPDGFAILFLCGAVLALLIYKRNEVSTAFLSVAMGMVCGVIHMTRADGFVWFLLAGGFLFFHLVRKKQNNERIFAWKVLSYVALFAGSYLLISGWWYFRNWKFFGSLMPPGGMRGLWLTGYEDLFLFPPQELTIERWLATGWVEIILTRVKALGINLISFISVGGLIFLIPGLFQGFKSITDRLLRNFWIAGFGLVLLIMSVVFPYAGIRGGFLHSMAITQPFLWIILPVGISRIIQSILRHKNSSAYSDVKIMSGTLIIAFIVSIFLIYNDRNQPLEITQAKLWDEYREVEDLLISQKAPKDRAVIVANPAAYYAVNLRPAVMIPTGDPEQVLTIGRKFQAEYLVVAENSPLVYQPLLDSIRRGEIPAKEIGISGNMQVFQLDWDQK